MAEARVVVPGYIVDAWLAGEKSVTLREDEPEARGPLGADGAEPPPGWKFTVWGIMGERPGDPEIIIQQGLRLLSEVRHYRDRDLFDQLGLPEDEWVTLIAGHPRR